MASCHPRRRTRPSLDGLCATCACAVRADVRRGQSPDDAMAKLRIRMEEEATRRAANGAALRDLSTRIRSDGDWPGAGGAS